MLYNSQVNCQRIKNTLQSHPETSQVCQIIDSINLFIHLYLTLIDGWQVDMILAKISAAWPGNFLSVSTFDIFQISPEPDHLIVISGRLCPAPEILCLMLSNVTIQKDYFSSSLRCFFWDCRTLSPGDCCLLEWISFAAICQKLT